jgi:hypothetical protein
VPAPAPTRAGSTADLSLTAPTLADGAAERQAAHAVRRTSETCVPPCPGTKKEPAPEARDRPSAWHPAREYAHWHQGRLRDVADLDQPASRRADEGGSPSSPEQAALECDGPGGGTPHVLVDGHGPAAAAWRRAGLVDRRRLRFPRSGELIASALPPIPALCAQRRGDHVLHPLDALVAGRGR